MKRILLFLSLIGILCNLNASSDDENYYNYKNKKVAKDKDVIVDIVKKNGLDLKYKDKPYTWVSGTIDDAIKALYGDIKAEGLHLVLSY